MHLRVSTIVLRWAYALRVLLTHFINQIARFDAILQCFRPELQILEQSLRPVFQSCK